MKSELKLISDSDFEIHIGSADGGRSFLRVIHMPSRIERTEVGLTGKNQSAIKAKFLQSIKAELIQHGWQVRANEA